MYLKFCSVPGLFYFGASKRSQSLRRLFTWGAPPVMHTVLGEVIQMSVPALCLHPTAAIRLQKASISEISASLESLLP